MSSYPLWTSHNFSLKQALRLFLLSGLFLCSNFQGIHWRNTVLPDLAKLNWIKNILWFWTKENSLCLLKNVGPGIYYYNPKHLYYFLQGGPIKIKVPGSYKGLYLLIYKSHLHSSPDCLTRNRNNQGRINSGGHNFILVWFSANSKMDRWMDDTWSQLCGKTHGIFPEK